MAIDLLPALAAYIPRDRVQHLLTRAPLAADGVAMIADISGFTPLTEALTHGLSADHGAEELTRALDSVFTPLIAQVHRYGGSVIKFGGDALIVWFGREKRGWRTAVLRRALTAAGQMQQVMAEYGQISTPIGPVALRMKIGLAYGPVKRFNLGLPEIGFEDVLAGATLDRMAENEHHAGPGDIMVDAATLAWLPTAVTVTAWRDDVAVVGQVTRPARPRPWPSLPRPADETAAIASLAAYVPRPIVETLQAGQTQVAELKPVLSLFVQFHGLDYDADPEVESKLQTYFTQAQQVVARYDGRLNRLITGDKGSLLHIIFGAPRSVEEQEERAARCALDLQAECGGLPFITMQRIGVTSGRVFAGPVGAPQRHDYTTMGDAINLSARLMQNAAGDQILLDTAVRGQLSAAIQVTDLGHITVKGKAESIHIFAADAYRPPERQWRPPEPVFGRERELAVIGDRLAVIGNRSPVTDQRATGAIVTLIGEVGLGKTLLLDNLRREAEAAWEADPAGGMWAGGISLAYGNTFTGYLFIDLLRDLLNLPPGATPAQTSRRLRDFCRELFGHGRVESTYPYLAKFMNLPLPETQAARLEGLAGESLRWQVFEIVPDLLRALCARAPLVLALDDLQWTDPTSLQLVERIAPLTAELPLLLLLALRPETETRAWALVQGWEAAISADDQGPPLSAGVLPHTRFTLSPLSETAAAALVRRHAPELPARVVTYLVGKGGGNPLFLVELVRTLQLTHQGDFADMALDALDLPNSVQGLLLAQLDRLAVETRHTLQLASVIGKTFLNRVLARISTAEQQVAGLLAELEAYDYVRPDEMELGEAHTFRHALIQEGAYSTLLHERRRIYHRQVAEAFEQLFPAAIAEQAAFLAYHYEQAEDVDKAIYYLLEIADRSRLLYANEEAEALYGRVLALMETQARPDPQRRGHTYLKLAQVRANELDFAGAQAFYERAFDLLEQVETEKPATAGAKQPVFRWGILPEYAQNFDPGLVESLETWQVVANLFEGLVEIDNEWNVVPACARRWEVLDDGRRYRFYLRPDCRWSDGTPLTAHDFVFAWRRNLHPAMKSPQAYQLFLVVGAEAFHQGESTDPNSVGISAIDDLTLEVVLKSPAAYFPYLLAFPPAFPQPQHRVASIGDVWAKPGFITGNGAFRIGETSTAGVHLERNPYYAGYSPGELEKVRLQFTEPTRETYMRKQVDWARIDDQVDILYQQTDDTSVYLVQAFVTFVLGFACGHPPFNETGWRQAFSLCVNREQLVQEVWGGVQQPAAGGLIPPGIPGHSPEISLPFDPVKARSLLPKANEWKKGGIRFAAIPGFGQTPYFLQNAWQHHLGLKVEVVENISIDVALQGLKEGAYHLILLGYHVAFPDPDDILRTDFHRDSADNFFGWRNRRFDALLDTALTLSDSRERFDRYHQADQLLVQAETAVTPLYYLQAYGLLRHGFHLVDTGEILRSSIVKFKNIGTDIRAA